MIKTALYALILTLMAVGNVSANDYIFSPDKGIAFSWEKKDKVGTYTLSGSRIYGEVVSTDDDPHLAFLSLMGWSTKANTSYYAYASYNTRYVSESHKITALPILFTGQKQSRNDDLSHLSAFDFMMGRYTTGDNTANITLSHLCSIIRIEWQMEDDRLVKSITLSADEPLFVTEAEMNLPEQTVTATRKSDAFTLLLDNIEPESGKPLVTYMSLFPTNLTDKVIKVTITTEDGIEREAFIRGTDLQAGKTYPVVIAGKNANAKGNKGGDRLTASTAIASTLESPSVTASDFPIDTDHALTYDPNDGITGVEVSAPLHRLQDNSAYSLSGRKITEKERSKPYIMNGKKYIKR